MCIGITSPEVRPDLFARCDIVLDDPRQATAFLQIVADWAAGVAAR
jgi:hypothetical protein